ncbi:MAG: dimethylhistidine N-methyltransferase [Halieaceae bacterium]|jgi:dimethylhistidine N-methyltransferase
MPQALRRMSNVSFRDEHPDPGDGREEILFGLRQAQKSVNPKWLYDQRGSELFDSITRLPEYYPTRTEVGILTSHGAEISECCGHECLFIEPGSGSSEKVRILLEWLRPSAYVPVDISAEFLQASAIALGAEYPWLDIYAVCADFNRDWSFIEDLTDEKRVVFYPGSTIGNLEPDMAKDFLLRLSALIGTSGGAVIGVDTHKSSARLNAAYNDSQGVTAQFNLNVLRRLNALLEANFDESSFSHHAFYNEERRRIEMHLVSERAQQVTVAGMQVEFAAGESIHTENSYKYTPEEFGALAASAGLEVLRSWLDDEELFGVYYLRRAAGA